MSIKRQIADFVKTPVDLKMGWKRGSYGAYIPINERLGVKILTTAIFNTVKELKESELWQAAQAELRNIRTARKRVRTKSVVPKPYMVLPINIKESFLQYDEATKRYHRETHMYYVPGIFMEHIAGKRLTTVIRSYGTRSKIRSSLAEMFMAKGIDHDDMHDFNILVRNSHKRKSKYVVIDWDNTYVHIV